MQISAIVPAYNEEGWVGKTVEALKEIPEVFEIIVVDDGSTDNTAFEAWDAGATVCRSSFNQGKSQALRDGTRIAKGDIFAFVDADLKESALEVKKLISAIKKDEGDMIIASIESTQKAGLGLVKSLAYWGIRYHTGKIMSTPLSGQRVLKRSMWESLKFQSDGFASEVALTIESIKKGYRVKEVPVDIKHRFRGNDYQSFFHRGNQFFSVLKLLMQNSF
ncbi:MAG: glycosyltransferase family 2 protein [Bacillota bacterium]|nr:glycosyltransferase family 2 protein [Bacillota bacterium]